jgi:hypothetical protein
MAGAGRPSRFLVVAALAALAGCSTPSASPSASALARVRAAYVRFEKATLKLQSTGTACQAHAAPISCLAAADVKYGAAITRFAITIGKIPMPSDAIAAKASKLVAAAEDAGRSYAELGVFTTTRQLNSIMASSHLTANAVQMNDSYQALNNILGVSAPTA